MVTGSNCVLYYGEELPDRAASRRMIGTVVLQPYHPLVQSGDFAAYFPNCRRFVYWNPTGIHCAELVSLERSVRFECWDPRWKIARLDLRDSRTQEYVVETGINLLGSNGDTHGLFVDDLDLWAHGRRRAAAKRVLERVAAAAGDQFSWFMNRGFPLWRTTDNLYAVLLEELTADDVAEGSLTDAAWISRFVLPPVRRARTNGTQVFAVSYRSAGATPPAGLPAELATLTDLTLYGTPKLDDWPEELR